MMQKTGAFALHHKIQILRCPVVKKNHLLAVAFK